MAQQPQFNRWVEQYSAQLFRYAYWLCGERALAEDVVQEALLRAWRGRAALKRPEAARAWLYTIVRREFVREMKRHRATAAHDGMEPVDGVPSETDNAEVNDLRVAMAQLPRKYREPLLLQVLGGYDCSEIARMLRIKPGAVMTRLFRARCALRERLNAGLEHAAGASDTVGRI